MFQLKVGQVFGSRICSSENVALFRWHEYPPVWKSLWLITTIGWDTHSANSKPLNCSDAFKYLWIEWVERILNSNSYTSWSKLFEWEVADFLGHFSFGWVQGVPCSKRRTNQFEAKFVFGFHLQLQWSLLDLIFFDTSQKTNIEPKKWWFVDRRFVDRRFFLFLLVVFLGSMLVFAGVLISSSFIQSIVNCWCLLLVVRTPLKGITHGKMGLGPRLRHHLQLEQQSSSDDPKTQ